MPSQGYIKENVFNFVFVAYVHKYKSSVVSKPCRYIFVTTCTQHALYKKPSADAENLKKMQKIG